MAYADQQMSSNRIVAIIIVALLHVFLGWALISGLAMSATEKIVEQLTMVEIEEEEIEEEPPEEPDEPPPPEDTSPPPPVAPPPLVNINPEPRRRLHRHRLHRHLRREESALRTKLAGSVGLLKIILLALCVRKSRERCA